VLSQFSTLTVTGFAVTFTDGSDALKLSSGRHRRTTNQTPVHLELNATGYDVGTLKSCHGVVF
jgi:hypothetical protein